MKVIFLKQYGHFLSGRSLPKKIVAELNGEAEVTLDFSGVSACNQSFLNGLFQDIEAAGFKLADIKMVRCALRNEMGVVAEMKQTEEWRPPRTTI